MDEIIHVSKSAEAAFNKLFNYKFKTRVIYNLIDRQRIIERSLQPCSIEKRHKITLCNIGRLTPQKKQDRLIRVAEKLLNQYGLDVEVWILGQGELHNELSNLANSLNISNIVHFLGFQSNPYSFLKASDAFVLTSRTEGYPLVVAEALCVGKPIVSTNVTGPNEMLADGAGILTSEDVDDIALQIYELFTVPGRCEYYRNQAIIRSKIFCPERTMDEIYSALLGTE
jgi:glycosyltransferase involved in cell wall biosynthesis